MITLRTIAREVKLAGDDGAALFTWLVDNLEHVAAAFGRPVQETADALDRVHADGTLAAKVASTVATLLERERDAKRSAVASAMQAAVDAYAGDARALLDAITHAPPGSVLVAGNWRVPLATLVRVRGLARLRGAALTVAVTADGLAFRWTRPEGTRGGLTLRSEQAPKKDARGRTVGWTAVYDPDALAIVMPAARP